MQCLSKESAKENMYIEDMNQMNKGRLILYRIMMESGSDMKRADGLRSCSHVRYACLLERGNESPGMVTCRDGVGPGRTSSSRGDRAADEIKSTGLELQRIVVQ